MSEHRLRILVLAASRSFHTQRYVREMRRQGCHVLLASLERGSVLHYKLKRRGLVAALHYTTVAPEINLLVRRFQPHAVNAHFASGYGFAAAMSKAINQTPLVLHLWGSDILLAPRKSVFHRNKTRYALSGADRVLADSEYLVAQARRIGPVAHSHVIPWGVERRYLELHRADYRVSRPLRIIVPRPHEPVYNNFFLLRTLEPLLKERRITLTFPDWGAEAAEFGRLVERAGHGGVTLYARRSRDEHMAFVASHDVYLSGSLSDSSPASLIEAMALGLIPVAAEIPGITEWLDNDNGFTFAHAEPIELLNTVARLAGGKDDHASMRRGNLDRVKQRGVFEDNIAETIRIMAEAAGREAP
jgi:glycosyltransferase involved in cell wall biosynthesis